MLRTIRERVHALGYGPRSLITAFLLSGLTISIFVLGFLSHYDDGRLLYRYGRIGRLLVGQPDSGVRYELTLGHPGEGRLATRCPSKTGLQVLYPRISGVSGSLPPGMQFDRVSQGFSGTPTKTGAWEVGFYATCIYQDYYQQRWESAGYYDQVVILVNP